MAFRYITSTEEERNVRSILNRLYTHRRGTYGLKPRPPRVYEDTIRWLLQRIPPGLKTLEIGAGTGTMAALMAGAGYNVEAADFYDRASLEKIEGQFSIAGIRFADLKDILNNHHDQYELIYCHEVLEHVVDPEPTLLSWIAKLSSGGYLFIVCPNYGGSPFIPLRCTLKILSGADEGLRWRYSSVREALFHAVKNLINNFFHCLGAIRFIRIYPRCSSGELEHKFSDDDAVHLVSTRNVVNFLRKNDMEIVEWRRRWGSPFIRFLYFLFPGLAPTVIILARKK